MIRREKRKRAESLRLMVDCLPPKTRVAMLEGLRRYEIIAGAYSDRSGGVCPMLAAHRCGGRTDFSGFARAWDRFTGARRRSRRASQRELRTLTAQLEASLWNDEPVRELREQAGRLAREGSPKKRPPRVSVSRRPRPAWLLPHRAWDDYRIALEAALRQAEGSGSEGRPGEDVLPEPAPAGDRLPS